MKRLAITLGFPVPAHPLDVVRAYRDPHEDPHAHSAARGRQGFGARERCSPGTTSTCSSSRPFLHELDGGRYIGTDDIVIMRDPEGDWVNCGTYRVMVHDARRVACGCRRQARPADPREVFQAGQPCPVLVSCGHDPMLFLAGGNELRFGLSSTTTPADTAACLST